MALPSLNSPPIRTPMVDDKGRITQVWAQWFEILWRKTGAETNTAPLNVEGTSGQASAVAVTQQSGAPVASAPPGSIVFDTDTSTSYINPSGEEGGWAPL